MSNHLNPQQPPEPVPVEREPVEHRPVEHEHTLGEQIGESIRSEDEPIENTRPSAPLAMVMGTYPFILIILVLLIAAYFFWVRTAPDAEDAGGPAVPAETAPLEARPATTPAG